MFWRSRYVLIFLAAWLLGLCWAMSSPVGSSPDDNYHLTTIYCETGDEDLCRDIDGAGPDVTVEVPSDLLIATCYMQKPAVGASCTREPHGPLATNAHYNRGDYPPTFYAAMSIFAGDNVAVSVLMMRLFALTVALAVMAAAAAVAPSLRDSQIVAWSVGSLPLGMFLFPSTNPSSWGIAGMISMWPAAYAFVHATERKKALLAGATMVAAAVLATSRGDTAAITGGLLGLTAIVYVRSRPQLLAGGLAIAVALLLGIVFLAAGQSVMLQEGMGDDGAPSGLSLLARNLIKLPELWAGAIAVKWGLGWIDTTMIGIVWMPTLIAVGSLALMGLARIRLQRGLMLMAMAGVAVAYPIVILQLSKAAIGSQFQPRYVLPVLLVVFALSLSPLDDNRVTLSLPQRAIVTAGLFVASSFALRIQIRRYATGVDTLGDGVRSNTPWSFGPVSPTILWIAGSLAAGLLFLLVVALLRPARADSSDTPEVPAPAL